jgi:hypothetical protein
MSEQDNTSDDIVLGVSYSALEKASAKNKLLDNEILNMFFRIDKLERENEKLKADLAIAVEALKHYAFRPMSVGGLIAQNALKKIEGE